MASNGIEMQPELMKSVVVRVMGEEEPIGFDSVVAYHGQAALAMLAITFQGLRAPLSFLRAGRFDRAARPRRPKNRCAQSSANGFWNELLGGAVLRVVRIMSMKARNATGTWRWPE
jgi:hypothetical protein